MMEVPYLTDKEMKHLAQLGNKNQMWIDHLIYLRERLLFYYYYLFDRVKTWIRLFTFGFWLLTDVTKQELINFSTHWLTAAKSLTGHLLYVPYYNPRFVYFLLHFWRPKTRCTRCSFLNLPRNHKNMIISTKAQAVWCLIINWLCHLHKYWDNDVNWW